jgi:N-hydroxyarylamine O-acetyltransferase
MADEDFDQGSWIERIGYSGPLAPTLETLNGLIFAHANAISYETLDIMLGRPPRLDVGTLQDKMIGRKRGGYPTTRSGGASRSWSKRERGMRRILSLPN